MINFTLALAAMSALAVAPVKAPAPAPAAAVEAASVEVIYDAPEGTSTTYMRSGIGYAYDYEEWEVVIKDEGGYAGEMVETTDGTVYIKNPLVFYPTKTWIKGQRDGDVITVQLPQAVGEFVDEDFGSEAFYLYRMNFVWLDDAHTEGTFYVDEENQTITLEQDADGNWNFSLRDDNSIIGMAYEDGEWSGFGDFEQCYVPYTPEEAEIPAGIEPVRMAMTYGEGNGHFVSCIEDGENVYLGGIHSDCPDNWVVAKKDGDNLVIESGQYIGIDPTVYRYSYLEAADYTLIDYPEWGFSFAWYEPIEEMTFTLVDGVYTTESCLVVNPEKITDPVEQALDPIVAYAEPHLKEQAADVAAAPLAPIVTDFMEYDADWGMGYIIFDLPKVSEDGDLLNTDSLYYNMYVNDVVFVFYNDEYPIDVDEMENVPYNYSNGWDIDLDKGSIQHYLYYYIEYGVESIALQSFYEAEDGTRYYSDKTYVLGGTDSVADTSMAKAEAVSVEYYTLSGVRVANPTAGIYIQRTTYADGTTQVQKTLKR